MPQQLIVGNIVYLKSGGPLMTVTSFRSKNERGNTDDVEEYVECQWFTMDKLQKEIFPIDSLQRFNGTTLL